MFFFARLKIEKTQNAGAQQIIRKQQLNTVSMKCFFTERQNGFTEFRNHMIKLGRHLLDYRNREKKNFHQIHHFKRTAMTALLFLTENVTQISGKMFKTICYGFFIF
jgi:hypothetical protein